MTRREQLARYAIAVLAAIAATLVYLHVSEATGRLSRDLQYDDVTYAVDAARRLDIAFSQGLPAFASSLLHDPPRTYFSVVQAMAAFLVAGESDFAMYASNAWILLVAALALTFAMRDRTAGAWAVALAFVLTAPIAFFAVTEFRPDIPVGFTTALMAWLVLDAGFNRSPRSARLAGVMFGACLAIKPTFFLHTLAIGGLLFVGALAATRLTRARPHTRFELGARDFAAAAGWALAIAIPLVLVQGASIWHYFWDNTFGPNRAVWALPASLTFGQVLDQARAYAFVHSRLHLAAAPGLAAVMALALLLRRDLAGAIQVLVFLALAAVSATIVILGKLPTQFFYAPAHWLALLAATFAFARLAGGLGPGARKALVAAGAVVVVALAVKNSAYAPNGWSAYADKADSWNARLVKAIHADVLRANAGRTVPRTVLVFAASSVTPDTIFWVGRREGQPLDGPLLGLLGDFEQAVALLPSHDYVIVPNAERVPYDAVSGLPVAKLQGPLLYRLRHDARFAPLLPLDPQAPYYVFARRG